MLYYAKLNSENVVTEVIVIPNGKKIDFIYNDLNLSGRWIETSKDGSFRGLFAGVGYIYNEEKDIFIPPKPKEWFVLDEKTMTWYVPEGINEINGEGLTKEELMIQKIKFNLPDDIVFPGEEYEI